MYVRIDRVAIDFIRVSLRSQLVGGVKLNQWRYCTCFVIATECGSSNMGKRMSYKAGFMLIVIEFAETSGNKCRKKVWCF